MSRKNICWDNAPTENWFGSFKNERVYGERFAKRVAMKAMAFEYTEVFYYWKRRHSTLDYRPPEQFIQDWLAAQNRKQQVA
jgi:putative transposase